MSNKKQSSVDFILNAFNLLSDSDFKAWMLNNHDEIKAIHQKEIEDAYGHGQNNGYMYAHQRAITISKENYFNQTFGGQNNGKD